MTRKTASKKAATQTAAQKAQEKKRKSSSAKPAGKIAPPKTGKSGVAEDSPATKPAPKRPRAQAKHDADRAASSAGKTAVESRAEQLAGATGIDQDSPFPIDSLALLGVKGDKFATSFMKLLEGFAGSPDVMASTVKDHAQEQNRLVAEFVDAMREKNAAKSGGKAKSGKNEKEEASACAQATETEDPRFRSPLWQSHPFYRYLIGSYQASSRIVRQTADKVELDKDDRRAVDFMLKQMIGAMSPSNFALTNPEVLEATLDSGGENLRLGMANYLDDQEKGMVASTDPDAFAIGRDLALTPGKVVFENHIFQLIEYAPATEQVAEIPLLVVPPCINKYYILDLQPANSFIAHLLSRGIRVFLISWVNAGERHSRLRWDDYVATGVIAALETVCEITGSQQAHTLGYCIGGTLLACALSVLASSGGRKAASMSKLCSFLDFDDTGDIGLFVHEDMVRKHEENFAAGGLYPGRDLARMFAYLRPNDLVWPYVVNNYLLGKKPKPFDILHWNADSTNLPGRLYAWYLRHAYLDNDLCRGEVEVCGCKVKFDRLGLPGVAVACERDHIVPWRAAYSSALLLGRQTEFILASSGHVAGIVNPPARKKGHFFANTPTNGLPDNADQWLADAAKTEGGWWDRYADWLLARAGPKVAAPKAAGSLRHRPIEDAPGSYVSDPLPQTAQ